MDISKLKRNPTKVQGTLLEKAGQLITKSGCIILVPAGYTDKGLAVISSEVSILGIYAMVVGNDYAVSMATAMIAIAPDEIDTVTIDGEDFLKFSFNAGSVVIRHTQVVKEIKLVNYIMDYFIDYGHSPWFISYLDHAQLFLNSNYFNGLSLGNSQAVMDIITAHISRNPKKFEQYYRHGIKNGAEVHSQPTFIATRDIANNTTSNLARINGSELQRALKSAIISDPQRSEELEMIYMK